MKPELLAPAGNMECLETAFYFGADAAYIAGVSFGLRAYAGNFTEDEIRSALAFAHSRSKKIYVTVNSVIADSQIGELTDYLFFLADAAADAVIVSDPAVFKLIRMHHIALPVHLSTQVNTFNHLSALFWHEQGVCRIVLSRELSIDAIRIISQKSPAGLELEAFVHGAMCVAYSGRCLLSYALTGRSANRGECAQPCRWEYHLTEKGYQGQYFPVQEAERGTYILNSKDLMMIEFIPQLMEAGIHSFKIEGRMKSSYYVASVVHAYRQAIDAYLRDGPEYLFDPSLKDELLKSATRPLSTGFYHGMPQQDIIKTENLQRAVFVARVLEDASDGWVLLEQRNKFCSGDTLEVLSPHMDSESIEVKEIRGAGGMLQQNAPHPKQNIRIPCGLPLMRGDILRKIE